MHAALRHREGKRLARFKCQNVEVTEFFGGCLSIHIFLFYYKFKNLFLIIFEKLN